MGQLHKCTVNKQYYYYYYYYYYLIDLIKINIS